MFPTCSVTVYGRYGLFHENILKGFQITECRDKCITEIPAFNVLMAIFQLNQSTDSCILVLNLYL